MWSVSCLVRSPSMLIWRCRVTPSMLLDNLKGSQVRLPEHWPFEESMTICYLCAAIFIQIDWICTHFQVLHKIHGATVIYLFLTASSIVVMLLKQDGALLILLESGDHFIQMLWPKCYPQLSPLSFFECMYARMYTRNACLCILQPSSSHGFARPKHCLTIEKPKDSSPLHSLLV